MCAVRYINSFIGMFRREKTHDINIFSGSSPTLTSPTIESSDTIEKIQVKAYTYEELEALFDEASEKHILVLFYSHQVLPLSMSI